MQDEADREMRDAALRYAHNARPSGKSVLEVAEEYLKFLKGESDDK